MDNDKINNTYGKMKLYLENHDRPLVSVSGGSDSDIIVHMISTYFPEYLEKSKFVFFNTGLEYNATRNHLDYLEKRYNIKIDRIRGMPVPVSVKKYGVPMVSKQFSEKTASFCNGARYATDVVMGNKDGMYKFTKKQKELAIYIKENGIKCSSMCCQKSKKEPSRRYMKANDCDLNITGERMTEGGVRATAHKSCFEENNHGIDKFMPLWFWDNETKQAYKESEGIVYSDCYEVWGMKRTGRVGCPYSSRTGEELKLMKRYEPNLYKACINVFGTAYNLQDQFKINRHRILPDDNGIENE